MTQESWSSVPGITTNHQVHSCNTSYANYQPQCPQVPIWSCVQPNQLMTTDCIHHVISTAQLGPEPKPREFLIMGVSRVHAEGFYVLPTVLSVTSSQEITVLAVCPDLPCFLPKGQIILQALLLPESRSDTSFIAWTRQISHGDCISPVS